MVSPEAGDGKLAPARTGRTAASGDVARDFPKLLERLPATEPKAAV